MDRLRKIRNRQQARFLSHLQRTHQMTTELEQDVKRSYSFFEQDVRNVAASDGDQALLDEDRRGEANTGGRNGGE
jgi:hypothetical protein